MNKNRIRGIRSWASGREIAKPISIKSTVCKSGGCALKVVESTSGGLLPVPKVGTEGRAIDFDRTAEVSRRHSVC
jgi:hypothetical protein